MTVIEKQYMDSVININRMMRKAQDAEPDWEQRRYEIAKDAMGAILSNPDIVGDVSQEGEPLWRAQVGIAKTSVKLADLLIKELQKEPEEKKDGEESVQP